MPPQSQAAIRRRIQELQQKARQAPGSNPGIQNRIQGLRTSRNAIPAVDQDPRPPGTTSPAAQTNAIQNRLNTSIGATTGRPPTIQGAGNLNTGVGQNTGTVPNIPNAGNASTSTGASPATGSTLGPMPGQTDPRDARYWNDVAALMLRKTTDLRSLDIQGTYGDSNYQEGVERLTRQQPRDILSTRENANSRGEFYSSKTGEAIGILQQEFFLARSGLDRTQQYETAMRALMRDALGAGYTIDEAAAYADAVERAALREINRPAPGGAGGSGGAGGGGGGSQNGGGGGSGGSGGSGSGGGSGGAASPSNPGSVNVGPSGSGQSTGPRPGGSNSGSGSSSGGGGGNRPPRPSQNLPKGWTWLWKDGRWQKHKMGSGGN